MKTQDQRIKLTQNSWRTTNPNHSRKSEGAGKKVSRRKERLDRTLAHWNIWNMVCTRSESQI